MLIQGCRYKGSFSEVLSEFNGSGKVSLEEWDSMHESAFLLTEMPHPHRISIYFAEETLQIKMANTLS